MARAAPPPANPAPAKAFPQQPTTPPAPAVGDQPPKRAVFRRPIQTQWPRQSLRRPQSPHQNFSRVHIIRKKAQAGFGSAGVSPALCICLCSGVRWSGRHRCRGEKRWRSQDRRKKPFPGRSEITALQRIHQLHRKQPRLLRKILRARPIPSLAGLVRLVQKAPNLVHQVLLRRAQNPPRRLLQIFLRSKNVVLRLVLQAGLIARRKLRRNLRRRRSRRLLRLRIRSRFDGRFARRRRRFRLRRLHRQRRNRRFRWIRRRRHIFRRRQRVGIRRNIRQRLRVRRFRRRGRGHRRTGLRGLPAAGQSKWHHAHQHHAALPEW